MTVTTPVKTKTVHIKVKRNHNPVLHVKTGEPIEIMADESCTVEFKNGLTIPLDGVNPGTTSFTDTGHHKYDIVYPDGSRANPTGDIIVP